MTKKFVTRALIMVGLIAASATASFAQQGNIASKVRRVAADKENQQPVAASTVILSKAGAMNLTADQKAQIVAMNNEVSALHAERDRLWAEYKQVTSRPDFNDEMAEREAAPRMRRVVELNAQLAPLAAKQEARVSSILTASQRSQLGTMVSTVRAGF